MEDSLTVFYTQHLRGDLSLLPPLQTFLRRLRGEHAAGAALLLDLGESCAPDVFPCDLTGGRSSLIALDAMGYLAANVEGALADEDRAKLDEAHLQMKLVDTDHPYIIEAVSYAISPAEIHLHAHLTIDMKPSSSTILTNNLLRLVGVDTGQVGMARITGMGSNVQLVSHAVFVPPLGTLPDPVIAGTIDFILDEARYTQKRRGGA